MEIESESGIEVGWSGTEHECIPVAGSDPVPSIAGLALAYL